MSDHLLIAPHLLASAMGVPAGAPAPCTFCGSGPFGPGKDGLCAGCARCMGGSPNKTDPPLRMGSVVLDRGGALHRALKPRDLWPWLTGGLPTPQVISYSASYKRHHWQSAGVSSGGILLVGGDDGQIRVGPEEREVLLTVHQALRHLSRVELVDGAINSARALIYGPVAWERLNAYLAPHRASGLIALACACAPACDKADKTPRPQEDSVIDPSDKRAASLLGLLVWASSKRATDGKRFWGGMLLHRVRRFARLPLPDLVSRLIAELDVSPTAVTTSSAIALVEDMGPECQEQVQASIRARPDLVTSLAFREIKTIRAASAARKAEH